MAFNFAGKVREATRVAKKLRAFVIGPSGSGKTLGALLIAAGLVAESGGRVLVLDSENGRSDLKKGCPELGDFTWDVVSEEPSKVTSAMITALLCYAEENGYAAVVIDSLSHAWNAVTEEHSTMPGNSFTNWKIAKKPFHVMLRKMVGCDVHVIMTGRSKQVYEQTISEKGKKNYEKVGLAPQVEDNTGYEFDLVFNIRQDHLAMMDKSEGGLFEDPPYFQITKETGVELKDWLAEGEAPDLRRKKVLISRIKELVEGAPKDALPSDTLKSPEEYLEMTVDQITEEGKTLKALLDKTQAEAKNSKKAA